jgi:GT2 family glycosyltransferase
MSTNSKVSIVIVTGNGVNQARRCLDSVRSMTNYDDLEVIVCDDGSTDGTLEYLRTLPWVRTIENATNPGFPGSVNRAIEATDPGSDVVLVNCATEITQSDWLPLLRACAYSAPHAGVVGCRLRRPDGLLLHAGTYMPVETLDQRRIAHGEKDVNQYDDPAREVEGVALACCYIRRAILDLVGPLDPECSGSFEDADYCLRVREAGFRNLCCGAVTVLFSPDDSSAPDGSHEQSRAIFAAKWSETLRARPVVAKLGWHSVLRLPNGYSLSSQDLALALEDAGVHLGYKYLYGPGTSHPWEEEGEVERERISRLMERPIDPAWPQVVYGLGESFERNFGSYRIGFTMLEVDGLPSEWVRQANLMDEVWVPTPFNQDTFRASGVERPIHVVPLGVDPHYFHPRIRSFPASDQFLFLSVFEWSSRKAPELLLRAFNDEFRADEPATLLCRVITVDERRLWDEIAGLGLKRDGGRILVSMNLLVPRHQLGALYRSADCFVLTTRGEGWGLPIIEAMACGLPVIATDWGAHTFFANASNSYPIASEGLVEANPDSPFYRGLRWAQPSYDECRRMMRHVFENREEARARGAAASSWVRENFSWERSARAAIDRLTSIGVETGVEREVGGRN